MNSLVLRVGRKTVVLPNRTWSQVGTTFQTISFSRMAVPGTKQPEFYDNYKGCVKCCGPWKDFSSSNVSIRTFHWSVYPLLKKRNDDVRTKNLPTADDLEEEDDYEEDEDAPGDQSLRIRATSDRLDAVIKAGLNISKNKIQNAFLSDLIRINGIRPKKKSVIVEEGMEIDLIRRYNVKNPDYLDIYRLEILKKGTYVRSSEKQSDLDALLPFKVRRSKNLTIQNYKQPFKGNIET